MYYYYYYYFIFVLYLYTSAGFIVGACAIKLVRK